MYIAPPRKRCIWGPARVDPTPHIRPAGLANASDGQDASCCLAFGGDFTHEPPKNRAPKSQPAHIPGKLPPNITAVSNIARNMTHGDPSGSGLANNTPDILLTNRRPVHPLLQERGKRREANYKRKENQVLGRKVIRNPLLPNTLSSSRPFGLITHIDGDAGSLISPPPMPNPANIGEEVAHQMYVTSHHSYRPGEQRNRHYNFDRNTTWGISSGVDSYNGKVMDALHWQGSGQVLESKRVADFMERNRPALGKVFDPIADTMNVSTDHVFGYAAPSDEYGVAELIHPATEKSTGTEGGGNTEVDWDSTLVSPKIGGLESASAAKAALRREELNREAEERRALELIELAKEEHRNARPPIPGARRSYTLMKFDTLQYPSHGALSPGKGRANGVPSIRTDIRAPRMRSLADNQNYGDELDAKSLVNPDPYVFGNVDILEDNLRRLRLAETRRAVGA